MLDGDRARNRKPASHTHWCVLLGMGAGKERCSNLQSLTIGRRLVLLSVRAGTQHCYVCGDLVGDGERQGLKNLKRSRSSVEKGSR